ncbi:MAG TPA: biopolymer transporter ExbD [Arenimonas sp.]|nr:biopolymer transporter ExbD [Arenimonas sp.]HOZ06101.1 biopolymer transporter ExbD [Arenimonas sp.]HPO24211.1 biopolymer transporter ExbD [Arenimonas sp.]HPW32413.1 biopolymer transporter ExbD [Arenimonas sp.]
MNKITSPNMMAEINVTPLVDVMLVLLVIFMLVAPAITQTMSQNIAPSEKQTRTESHKLIVQAGDTYLLDGQMIGASELKQHFSEAIRADNKYTLQILGEPEASYQSFTQVMAIANNAGIENLSLASN